MKTHLAYPLVASAVLVACGFSVQAGTPVDCPKPQEPAAVVVADDPDRPLDPRDPQFTDKQAQRYRRWLQSAPAASGAAR